MLSCLHICIHAHLHTLYILLLPLILNLQSCFNFKLGSPNGIVMQFCKQNDIFILNYNLESTSSVHELNYQSLTPSDTLPKLHPTKIYMKSKLLIILELNFLKVSNYQLHYSIQLQYNYSNILLIVCSDIQLLHSPLRHQFVL